MGQRLARDWGSVRGWWTHSSMPFSQLSHTRRPTIRWTQTQLSTCKSQRKHYSRNANQYINQKYSTSAVCDEHLCVVYPPLSQSVENCVCILRNLSYHVHKDVPGAERFQEAVANQVPGLGGNQKKKKEADCFGGKKPKGELNLTSWWRYMNGCQAVCTTHNM